MTLITAQANALLVLDNENYTQLPKNFRSPYTFCKNASKDFDKTGLNKLRFSASGQFSEGSLEKALADIAPKNLRMIDLRLESHGFIKGQPISWYGYRNQNNVGLSPDLILERELNLLKNLKESESIEVAVIHHKQSGQIKEYTLETRLPEHIESEFELSKRLGFHYYRLPVLDRHPPDPSVLDDFVDIVTKAPEDTWFHLHCRAGKGRASTFAVLFDIIKNGDQVDLQHILDRQVYFGSKDLRQFSNHPDDLWKLKAAKARYELIQSFYEYRNTKDFPLQSWSSWLSRKEATS